MPSTRDIRRRIKSVKNTAQITKAMQMVASSKMRKAQQAALGGRPFAEHMNLMLAEMTAGAEDFTHPLMEQREVRKKCVILVGTDKGLCGALNSTLFRQALKYDKETTLYITAGRKAGQFVARSRRKLAAEFSYKDSPQFGEARAISRFAQQQFLSGECDRVEVLFTQFVSTLTQKPEMLPFLPITEVLGVSSDPRGGGTGSKLQLSGIDFLFEPGVEYLLGALLPHYMNFRMYQVLLEAKASEHSARMVAMKNATDNAQDLIKHLTLEYNKLRQANITKELLEISTAQMAMG
jgi:F-type H+-transporting ATPase subunit gamma